MAQQQLQVLQLRPGVNREGTSYAGEGGWYECDKIRFRSGLPEKIGGWAPYSSGTYLGSCKHFAEWVSLSNYYLLGVGTNLKYYILTGGVYYDITPIRLTHTVATTNPFLPIYSTLAANIGATDTTIFLTGSTTFNSLSFVVQIGTEQIFVLNSSSSGAGTTLSGCIRGYNGTTAAAHLIGSTVSSSWMVVNDSGNAATPGDFVTFTGATGSAGGLTAAQLNSQFEIEMVNGSYIIFDTGIQSTSASVGGGSAVVAAYQIATGLPYTQTLNGWGAGTWVGLPLGTGSSALATNLLGNATINLASIGGYYQIVSLGTTTQAQWNTLAGTTGVTYAAGNLITCAATVTASYGTGTITQLSIPLVSAATFPASGYIIIESEIIQYTGVSTNTLTGLTRGVSGNTTSHLSGTPVSSVVYSAGTRAWSTAYTGGGFTESLRLWSANNFGQNLFFNPRNGAIYYWDAAQNLTAGGKVTLNSGEIITNSTTITSFASIPASEVVVGNYYQIVSTGGGSSDFTLDGAANNNVGTKFTATATTTSGTGWLVDPAIPAVAAQVLVTDERFVMAYGCNDYVGNGNTVQDPMFIAWSDQEQPQVWYPAVTNQAGSFRLTYGSKIITAVKTRQEILVFTDTALYSQQYLGPPYVYGFNPISVDITIVSPNAAVTTNGITYWMGQDKFYAYSGRVDTLPCALRQYVFDDINREQWALVCCGTNEKYNEVWWFYPSEGSTYNDKYVVYNYLEKLWYYGLMERSAWFDSHIVGDPLGAVNNIVVQHETGCDDGTTNPPQAIDAYITTSDFDLGDGGYQFSFVKRLIPDVDFIGSVNQSPSVTMTLTARNYPGIGLNTDVMQSATGTIAGSKFTTQVYSYTNQVWVRLRGRQLAFTIESTDLGVRWQAGVNRIEIQPDGRK